MATPFESLDDALNVTPTEAEIVPVEEPGDLRVPASEKEEDRKLFHILVADTRNPMSTLKCPIKLNVKSRYR